MLKLHVDRKRVKRTLSELSFCKPGGYPIPNFTHLHQSQDMTNKRIAEVLRGVSAYYALANDRKASITYFAYILRISTARMYAAKFRLHSIRKVFKKGGKYLDKIIDNRGKGHGALVATILKDNAPKGADKETLIKDRRVAKIPYAR